MFLHLSFFLSFEPILRTRTPSGLLTGFSRRHFAGDGRRHDKRNKREHGRANFEINIYFNFGE